jgi:competence protein ComEC
VQQSAALPSPWWSLLLLPLGVAAWFRPVWLIAVGLVAGVVWAGFRAGLILDEELPAALESKDLVVEGTVANLPKLAEFGQRFEFDVTAARAGGVSVRVPSHILLTLRNAEPALRAGDRWQFTVRLVRPHGFQNPGGFDYEAYLFANRIRARGYVRDVPPAKFLGVSDCWRCRVNRVRQALGERIRSRLGDAPQAGVIVALANGDERGVSEADWTVFRRTGTLHLVAISGLHITLIAGIVFFLVSRLWALPGATVLRLPAPVAGAVGALVAATGYAALAGFVVPTQRALIMLAVAMFARMSRRRLQRTQVLAAALLAVLVYDPLAVMAPGFWLSFAAVAVILFAAAAERGRETWWRKWGYLQWAIALGMLPLGLLLFGQVSLAAPLANMVAVPVFDLLAVPLTLAGMVALALLPDPVAGWCFHAALRLLHVLWPLLTWLGGSDALLWCQPRPPWWTIPGAVVGAALLLAPRGWPGRWVGVVWLLPMLLVRPPGPGPGEAWFTLLDVGEGLASVVRTEHHVLVFDAGPVYGPGFDAGAAVVVPYLRGTGAGEVDTLVVSHGDSDHIGGVASLRAAWRVGRIVSSVPEQLEGASACVADAGWEWDGVVFTFLNPPLHRHGKHNNASCVLAVRSAHGRILIPGDIEAPAERDLVARYGSGMAAEILVAPHHGSRTSSTDALVESVHPRFVLFSTGYRNRFHHPQPAVVARYRRAGAATLETPVSGAIEFRLRAGAIEVKRFRERARRFWFVRTDDAAEAPDADRRYLP